jgi:hypothetical protein
MYWVARHSRVDVLGCYTVKDGCIGLLDSVDVSGGGVEGENLKDLEVKR